MIIKPALLSFTALLFCLPFVSIAQKNFVKGYFVTSRQDTIHCLINDQN